MIRFLLPLVLGAHGAVAADMCGDGDPTLIWSSCDGAVVDLLLLPEDANPTPAKALDVSGGYTATDTRAEGAPKPVGLFVRDGDIISREYVRFDGVLTIDAAGAPLLHYRRAVRVGEDTLDLEDPDARREFLALAAAEGMDVLQSHLLIINGSVDTAPVAGAPVFRRRIFFQMPDGGFGVFDSSPRMLTLDKAAREVADRFAPAMALNLDMGSYDFCQRGEVQCGVLSTSAMSKLSNILRFRQR